MLLKLYCFVMEQEKGFSFSKKRKLDADQVGDSTSLDINHKVGDQVTVKDSSALVVYKRQKITEMPLAAQTTGVSPSVIDGKTSSPNNAAPGLHHFIVLIFSSCMIVCLYTLPTFTLLANLACTPYGLRLESRCLITSSCFHSNG